jgi:hypothetical protein
MKKLFLIAVLLCSCGGVEDDTRCSIMLERQCERKLAGVVYDEDANTRDFQATLGASIWGNHPKNLRVWMKGRYELVEMKKRNDGLYWGNLDVRLEPHVTSPLKLIDIEVYSSPDVCYGSSFLYYIQYGE